jgi:hypothetical protein
MTAAREHPSCGKGGCHEDHPAEERRRSGNGLRLGRNGGRRRTVNAELLAAVKALTSQLADLKEEVRLTRQEAAKARAEARGLRAPAGVPRPAAYAGSGSAAPVPSAGRGDNLKAEPDWSGPYAGLAIGGVAPQISSRGSFGNTSRSGAFPPPPFNSFLESTTVGATVGRARDAVGGALTASVGYNFAVGSWGGAGLQAEGSWLDVRADQNTRTDQTGRSVTLVAGCPASICFFPTPPSVSVSAFTSSNTFRTQVEPTWLMSALLRGGALITPSTLFYAVAGLSYTKFDTGFSASGDSTGSPAATLGIVPSAGRSTSTTNSTNSRELRFVTKIAPARATWQYSRLHRHPSSRAT